MESHKKKIGCDSSSQHCFF